MDKKITASKRRQMKAFSRNLFGTEHRLEVALTMLDFEANAPHDLYKQAIADKLKVTDTEIEKHLRAFREIGMLERHPNPPPPPQKRGRGQPPQVLKLSDDHFWRCLNELGDRFRRD